MAYVVAALGALSVFHLVLTFGIIRRLRAQEAQVPDRPPTVEIGQRVGDYAALTTDGSPVGRTGDGRRLTAFFTPDCRACMQQLPLFLDFATGFSGDIVVVVVTDDVALASRYPGIFRTVVEPPGGVVATAFAVTSFPAMVVTDAAGVVLANGNSVRDLASTSETVEAR